MALQRLTLSDVWLLVREVVSPSLAPSVANITFPLWCRSRKVLLAIAQISSAFKAPANARQTFITGRIQFTKYNMQSQGIPPLLNADEQERQERRMVQAAKSSDAVMRRAMACDTDVGWSDSDAA